MTDMRWHPSAVIRLPGFASATVATELPVFPRSADPAGNGPMPPHQAAATGVPLALQRPLPGQSPWTHRPPAPAPPPCTLFSARMGTTPTPATAPPSLWAFDAARAAPCHSGRAEATARSADGRFVARLAMPQVLQIGAGWRCGHDLSIAPGQISHFAWSPVHVWLAVASRECPRQGRPIDWIHIFDAGTGELLLRYCPEAPATRLAWSADANVLYLAHGDRALPTYIEFIADQVAAAA